jgi:hypothetical protein
VSSRWRMESKCADCPFASSGPGLALRKSLGPGRWKEITTGLRRDLSFNCHKTTHETGDGSEKFCAGAIEWLESRGLSTNLMRVMERLDWLSSRRRETEEAR